MKVDRDIKSIYDAMPPDVRERFDALVHKKSIAGTHLNRDAIKRVSLIICDRCGEPLDTCWCGDEMQCPDCGRHKQKCHCG